MAPSVVAAQWVGTPTQSLESPYGTYAAACRDCGQVGYGAAMPSAGCGPPLQYWDPYTCQPAACAPVVIAQAAPPAYENRFHLFGEFLFLRPSDAATVTYALPVNGVVAPPAVAPPAGPAVALDADYDVGFRFGGGVTWNSGRTELLGAFTRFDSDAASGFSASPPSPVVLSPLVFHPATLSAGSTYTSVAANGSVAFDLADIGLRNDFSENGCLRSSYYLGARYASMEQNFNARFDGGVAPGPAAQDLTTRIDFDGAGIRLGLAGDLASKQTGLFAYSNGYVSLIAGEFNSSYRQTDATASPIVSAETSQSDQRVVPIVDLELGVGWQTDGGGLRLSAGYLVSTWFNIVGAEEYIRSVQSGVSSAPSDMMTFDGLTARADLRF